MPDSNNRTGRDFSEYDEMNDEQLRQILREDASKTEGEDTDLELMLHIMEVLARRRRETSEEISPEESLEQFKKKYTYTDNSLISEKRPATRKATSFSRWQRWVATIAAVLILVFGSALTAQALGFDLWEIFVKWTQETFHFSSSSDLGANITPEKEDSSISKEFQKVLEDYGITASLLPTYFPEGYREVDVKVNETPKQRIFTGKYENGEKSIRIRVSDYLDGYPLQIEQSNDLIETITYGDTEFYIFENYEQLRAVWIEGHYECYVIGELSVAEMKEIIASIKKG